MLACASFVLRLTPGHVQIQNRDAEAVQVLVEYALERRADEVVALVETGAAPGVEATGLELEDGVWRCRALLLVECFPVGGEFTFGPDVWVCAVEA